MDLYRLAGSPKDLEALDLVNILSSSLCLLEWPDRLGALTPTQRLEVTILILDPASHDRSVRLRALGRQWADRCLRARAAMDID